MTWNTEEMCKAAQRLLAKERYIAYGIGIPLEIVTHSTFSDRQILYSDNGMLGVQENAPNKDKDIAGVGRRYVTPQPYTCYVDCCESFAISHGGHLDAVILGAMQVSISGDIASWKIPGVMLKGCGGAMDLLSNSKRVVVMMNHRTKNNEDKILTECTLPLTAKNVATEVITEMGTFGIDKANKQLYLIDKPDNLTIAEIQQNTGITIKTQ